MHNQQLMKDTYAEVSHLYSLSLTPLSLVGIPRALSGKTMDQWVRLPLIYGYAAVCHYLVAPLLISYSPAIARGVSWAGIATLAIAVTCHLGMMAQDVHMFASIKARLEVLITPNLLT